MESRNGIAYLSFTERGKALSERLCASLGGEAVCTRVCPGVTLSGWTEKRFSVSRALVYVGAVGIAVRAVAPHLRSKTADPAVIAVDEYGRFAVPLVSGHLGGANDLAREIAALTGGTAVITTATDLNGVFAVDEWAKRQNCAVIHPEHIKAVSGKRLSGGTVRVFSAYPVAGEPPEGVECVTTDADIWVDVSRRPPLSLAPRVLTLGVGCRRGTRRETLERRFATLCEAYSLWPEAFRAAATIDLKAEEPGLLDFCAAHGWKLRVFSADELREVPGVFTASAFVERHAGVENVCERAAVLDSQGELLAEKYAGEGVTLAVARRSFSPDWNWR